MRIVLFLYYYLFEFDIFHTPFFELRPDTVAVIGVDRRQSEECIDILLAYKAESASTLINSLFIQLLNDVNLIKNLGGQGRVTVYISALSKCSEIGTPFPPFARPRVSTARLLLGQSRGGQGAVAPRRARPLDAVEADPQVGHHEAGFQVATRANTGTTHGQNMQDYSNIYTMIQKRK